MRQTTALAISRQLGSGGSTVGREVARRLNLRYADRDVLQRAAETLGVVDADIEPLEERVESLWERLAPLFWVQLSGPSIPGTTLVTGSALFDAETRIIEALASKEDIVIVGRGAAHFLRHHCRVISAFIHAPEAFRVERVVKASGIKSAAALALIHHSDRERSAFHRSLAHRDWCDATQYDLCVDTSAVGIELATDTLVTLVSRVRDRSGS